MKKIWKDRSGAITPIALVLVFVVILALVGVAYMAYAQYGEEQNENQDKNSKDDKIIGRMMINVKVKIVNPVSLTDGKVVYSIDKVDATLIEVEPTSFLDILGGLELWKGDANLKLTCKLVYDQSPQVLISPNSNGGKAEWEQEYPGSWNRVTDWVGYHTEDFYSGSLYYNGNYYVEINLYKDSGGAWVKVDTEKMSVSI